MRAYFLALVLVLSAVASVQAQSITGRRLGDTLPNQTVAEPPYTADDSFLAVRNNDIYRVPGDRLKPLATYNPVADRAAPVDGIADAAVAINLSLNDCAAGGGGIVTLPPRQFVISSTNLIVPKGCELRFPAPPEQEQAVPTNFSQPALRLATNRTIELSGALRNIAIIQRGLTVPTSVQDAYTQVVGFAGTAITVKAYDVRIDDAFIVGFNTCVDVTNQARPRIFRVAAQCKNVLHLDNIHDVGHFYDIHAWGYYPGNSAYAVATSTVSAVADNGSGLYRLTVGSTADLATGNPVTLSGIGGKVGANGNRTITVVDATHIDIQGSSTTSVTATGTWNAGETLLFLTTLPQGIWYGSVVAGTGIPVGSTVSTIDFDKKTVRISAPTTLAGGAAALTFTDPGTYTSGGKFELWPAYKPMETFISVTNSEQNTFTDVFEFGWDVGIALGAASRWQLFSNFGCDQFIDPSGACVVLTDDADMNSFTGGQFGGNQPLVVEKNIIGINSITGIIARNGQINHTVEMSLQGFGELMLTGSVSDCAGVGCGLDNIGDVIIYAAAGRKVFGGMLPRYDIFPQNAIVAGASMIMQPGTVLATGSPYGYENGTWTPRIAVGGNSTGFVYSAQFGAFLRSWPYLTLDYVVQLGGTLPGQTGILSIEGEPTAACTTNPSGSGISVTDAIAVTGLTGAPFTRANGGASNLFLSQSGATGSASLTQANLTTTSLFRGSARCRLGFVAR